MGRPASGPRRRARASARPVAKLGKPGFEKSLWVRAEVLPTAGNVAWGTQVTTAAVGTCPAFDGNADGSVTIDELVTAVRNALNGYDAVAR